MTTATADATGVPLIEAHDLTVRFGRVTALDRLELSARPGSVLAVLGPNGAGKTTFVRCVATLVRPDGGRLRVRGQDVVRDAAKVRRDIGLAGQFAAVEPTMTGRENLEMTARLFGHGRIAGRRAAVSISARASSVARGCSCSTSPPPVWIRSAGARSGLRARTRGGRHRHPAHHALPGGGRPAG